MIQTTTTNIKHLLNFTFREQVFSPSFERMFFMLIMTFHIHVSMGDQQQVKLVCLLHFHSPQPPIKASLGVVCRCKSSSATRWCSSFFYALYCCTNVTPVQMYPLWFLIMLNIDSNNDDMEWSAINNKLYVMIVCHEQF